MATSITEHLVVALLLVGNPICLEKIYKELKILKLKSIHVAIFSIK